jgi:hypothetical protein
LTEQRISMNDVVLVKKTIKLFSSLLALSTNKLERLPLANLNSLVY